MSKEGLIEKVPSEQKMKGGAPLGEELFQAELKAKSKGPDWDLASHRQEGREARACWEAGPSQVVAGELQEEVGPDAEAPGCTICKGPTGCCGKQDLGGARQEQGAEAAVGETLTGSRLTAACQSESESEACRCCQEVWLNPKGAWRPKDRLEQGPARRGVAGGCGHNHSC